MKSVFYPDYVRVSTILSILALYTPDNFCQERMRHILKISLKSVSMAVFRLFIFLQSFRIASNPSGNAPVSVFISGNDERVIKEAGRL